MPGTYTSKITFEGDENYSSALKSVKVVVSKRTPKFTPLSKTFKVKTSAKKYTVLLKAKSIIKKAKITLTLNGKKYSGKTDGKGKVTFKLKLTKKGTYKGIIKYSGNKYYKSITKTVKIKVKS